MIVTMEGGSTATIVELEGDIVTLRWSKPAPPGARIAGTIESGLGIRMKVHHAKRGDDGVFTIRARVIDITRALRDALTQIGDRNLGTPD